MNSNQIGFCKGFRTANHVLTIKTLIGKYLSENKKLYFCFVNFRKTYDSTWHEALFKKLLGYEVSTNSVSFLRNIYETTKLHLHLQGCKISPILFSLLVNDINEILDVNFCHPVFLDNIKLSNLLYSVIIYSNIWNKNKPTKLFR